MKDAQLDFIELEHKLLSSPSTHVFVKELINRGRDYDCVDFVNNLETVLRYATMRMNYYLSPDTTDI